MPKLGVVKGGKELGFVAYYQKFIWRACVNCGKERWVQIYKGEPRFERCASCSRHMGRARADQCPAWKGGRTRHSDGYVQVKLQPNDFFFSMVGGSQYILEHRLVMAKHLGRCLQIWEMVHHKNGVKDDNRIENLELICRHDHMQSHGKGYQDGYLKGILDGHGERIKRLESRITMLEAENILLKEQLFKEETILGT